MMPLLCVSICFEVCMDLNGGFLSDYNIYIFTVQRVKLLEHIAIEKRNVKISF